MYKCPEALTVDFLPQVSGEAAEACTQTGMMSAYSSGDWYNWEEQFRKEQLNLGHHMLILVIAGSSTSRLCAGRATLATYALLRTEVQTNGISAPGCGSYLPQVEQRIIEHQEKLMQVDAIRGVSDQSWSKFADRQPQIVDVVDTIAENLSDAESMTSRDIGQVRYISLFVYNTLRDCVQRKALETLAPITFADPSEWY